MGNALAHKIIKRLEAIREANNGFKPELQRWKDVTVTTHGGRQTIHVSQASFGDMYDDELVQTFEMIVKRSSKLM